MIDSAAGRFVAIVGPSGAGKDSLIAHARHALAADPRFVFPHRVVTRPPDATEPHESVDALGFRKLAAAGGFALQWEAHGLSYGIPASVAADVARGRIVVANLSRSVLPTLRHRFARALVIEIKASPAVLAARLSARGRETQNELRGRLARASAIPVQADITISNDGSLEEAGRVLVEALERAATPQASMLPA